MKGGISLIEVLITMAIIVILASVAIPNFGNWMKARKIEKETNRIYGFLQELRVKAFTKKQDFTLSLSNSSLCAQSGNSTYCIDLTLPFTMNGTISITKRGTFGNGRIYYPGANPAKYDCVILSGLRARMDKCNEE